MDRKYASGAAGSPPALDNNSDGFPTEGNPGTGTPATKPGAHMFYMIVEEIMSVITDAGLTPSKLSVTQLRDAVRWMANGSRIIASVGGTGDVITGTVTPAPTFTSGQQYLYVPAAANTTNTTINLNGTGAKQILGSDGQPLVGTEFLVGVPYLLGVNAAGDKLYIMSVSNVLMSRGVEVGTRDVLVRSISATGSSIASDRGNKILITGTTASQTLTIDRATIGGSSTVRSRVTIENVSTQSWSIAVSAGTLSWVDGSGAAPLTGTRTLARNSECELECDGTNFDIRGNGLT